MDSKESLIRPLVAETLDIPESLVGVSCGLNLTLIAISPAFTMVETDRQKVAARLLDKLQDRAYVNLGMIRFL